MIGNAVKFTSKGGLEIIVSLVELNNDRVKLKFQIFDTGIGICEENTYNLFQSFYQVDNSNTRRFGGTGLGLVISKNLIDMMGGQIGVHSTIGVGSEFYFTVIFGYNAIPDEDFQHNEPA